MTSMASEPGLHPKRRPLRMIIVLIVTGLLGGIIWGQLTLQKKLAQLDEKISALENASRLEAHNLEMQAQFNMMASRLSALQADLTQIKAQNLQP